MSQLLLGITPCLQVALLAYSAAWHPTEPAVRASTAESTWLRPGDRVWLISSRHLSCGHAPQEAIAALHIQQFGPAGWRDATLEEFLSLHEPEVPLRFHVHGARVDQGEDSQRSWTVYEQLVRSMPDEEPVHLVSWSWPTSKQGRPLRDLRSMMARSDWESLYLGQILARLPQDSRIEMLGYSLGCRVICGALHTLAGGELLGQTLDTAAVAERRRIRVVMWAPALPCHWLWPGQPRDRALDMLDELLVVYNSCDRALRRYWIVDPYGDPQALGHTGLILVQGMEAVSDRIRQIDANCLLGCRHSFYNHVGSSRIVAETLATFRKAD